MADVLATKTFSNSSSAGLTGTMTNVGQQTITPTTTNQPITQGYHDGTGYAQGDTDLVAANIKCGETIFGVTGTLPPGCVAKTGLSICYDVGIFWWSLSVVDCYGTGQDGEYQKGCDPGVVPSHGLNFANYKRTSLPCSSAGFTDNGNETVTDNLTGLMWSKDASPEAGGSGTEEVRWLAALTYCNDLSLGGHTDWRLPNINELRSLFDPGLSRPYLPAGHRFTGVQSNCYWSSTLYADSPDFAWFVDLDNGYVNKANRTSTRTCGPFAEDSRSFDDLVL